MTGYIHRRSTSSTFVLKLLEVSSTRLPGLERIAGTYVRQARAANKHRRLRRPAAANEAGNGRENHALLLQRDLRRQEGPRGESKGSLSLSGPSIKCST